MSDIPQDIVLRRQQNAEQAISRLPPEILLIIFRETEVYKNRADSHKWFQLLHVCHLWYTIGTGSPLLWDTVSSANGPDCVRTMLQRSQDIPLSVFARPIPVVALLDVFDAQGDFAMRRQIASTNDASYALLRQMPRIQHLSLKAGDLFWKTVQKQHPPCTATTLSLSLVYNPEEHDLTFNADTDWVFASPLPNLRELRLYPEIPVLGTIRAPALRVLHVSVTASGVGTCNARDLLESLRQMPLLEEAVIEYPFPDLVVGEELDNSFNCDVVHLPNMRSFAFVDDEVVFSRFLRCLELPPTAQLTLGCGVYSGAHAAAAVAALGEKLAATSCNTEPLPIRNLSISIQSVQGDSSCRLRFEGCTHAEHKCFCVGEDYCDSPSLSFTLSYKGSTGYVIWDTLAGFTDTLEAPFLKDVEILHIQSVYVYRTVKAHLGIFTPAGLVVKCSEEIHHFTVPAAQGEIACELEERLLRLLPKLKTICLDLTTGPRSRPGLELDGMLDATMIAGFYLSAHRQNDGGDDDTDSGSDTDGEMMSTLIIGTGPAADWRD